MTQHEEIDGTDMITGGTVRVFMSPLQPLTGGEQDDSGRGSCSSSTQLPLSEKGRENQMDAQRIIIHTPQQRIVISMEDDEHVSVWHESQGTVYHTKTGLQQPDEEGDA